MVEPVVAVALENIRDLLVQEGKLLLGVRDQVEELRGELETLESFLKDANRRKHEDERLRTCVNQAKGIAYKAQDIVEEYAIKVASKRGEGFRKVARRVAGIVGEGIIHEVGNEIGKIKTETTDLIKRLEGYGINQIIEAPPSPATIENQRQLRTTYAHEKDEYFVGMEDDVSKIVTWVTEDNKIRRIISICGVGGLGKTTIARKVYDHRQVKESFECFAWVSVTRQCQVKMLLHDILIQMVGDKVEEEEASVHKLYDVLEKLTYADCRPLLESIIHKMEAWSNKHLSFAGRLVLINTVVFGKQNYWSQTMFLPIEAISKIEEAVRKFLWKGDLQSHYMPKVKWKKVTEDKVAGGLGVKNLREWNAACMYGHIWDICSMKESLWVKWITTYKIKGGSFWNLEEKSTDSSIWRQLLKKRKYVRHLITTKIGDGTCTNFMHDNWHPRGVLADTLSEETKRNLRIEDNMSVANVVKNGKWPKGRKLSPEVIQLKLELPTLWQGVRDKPVWGKGEVIVRTKTIWRTMHPVARKPDWTKVMWFKGNIPKHSFLCWVLFHEKLPTKDRLKEWKICEDDKCIFCEKKESMNHLFFECQFSGAIWRKMLMYLNDFRTPKGWNEESKIVVDQYRGKSFKKRLQKLCLNCVVYEVWRERNKRIFEDVQRTVDDIVHNCIVTIRHRVCRWEIPRTKTNWMICVEWGFPLEILK